MNHIREKLPDMKARLNTLMGQTQQELNSFGDATFLGEQHRVCTSQGPVADIQGSLILKLMTEFARDFVSSIEGTSLEISTKELCGGARIYYIFNEVFGHALQTIDPTQNLTINDIRTAIRNSTGPRPSMFVPEVAFDLLVKPQIKLLEPPSLRCVELVYEELMKICHNCTSPELQRFPRLHTQLIEVVSELLRERLGPTSEYVSSLISIQAAYINTNHPDFQAGQAAIAAAGSVPMPPPKMPSLDGSVEDSESEEEDDTFTANGTSSFHGHPRAASASQPNLERTAASKMLAKNGHNRASSSASATPAPAAFSPAMGGSPQNAKETFLNYFFGGPQGPGMPPTAGTGGSRRPQPIQTPTYRSHDILPDLGSGRRNGPAQGLDQPTAAYDMKSLAKHLDSSEEPLNLSPREQMESNLIRSLIASYFTIVRQTIEDLVPKSIMHLLVSFEVPTKLTPGELFPRRRSATLGDISVQARLVPRVAARGRGPRD